MSDQIFDVLWSRTGFDGIIDKLVVLIVPNEVLLLRDHLHGREHVEGIVNAPLHVLEVHLVAKALVELLDLVGYLCASRRRFGANAGQDGPTQEYKLLVLLFLW